MSKATPQLNKTPFQRYGNGTPFKVGLKVRAELADVLAGLNDWTTLKPKLIKLAQTRRADTVYGRESQGVWQLAFYELAEEVSRHGDFTKYIPFTQGLLEIVLATESLEACWEEVKEFIVHYADEYSGWDATAALHAQMGVIDIDENGDYFTIEDGKKYIVHGRKTESEERMYFLAGVILDKYGKINSFLRLLALIAISDEYQANQANFPDQALCILPEGENETWFLHWKWELVKLGEPIRTFWRPRNCFCDPEWLANDLMARVIQDIPDTPTPRRSLSAPEVFNKAFLKFPHKLDIGLRTVLFLGDGPETYFEADGLPIRWVNGTAFENPVISVGCAQEDFSDGIIAARKFMAAVAIEASVSVVEGIRIGSARQYHPMALEPKVMGGLGIDPESVTRQSEKMKDFGEREWSAAYLYRQGSNAESPSDAFLNYYKIIELLSPGKDTKAQRGQVDWINNNITAVLPQINQDWEVEVIPAGSNPGSYLCHICRPKAAHAQPDKGNQLQVDNQEERNLMEKNVRVVRSLAKKIIEERLLK